MEDKQMERTINTKFFTFRQNNSGGYHIVNDFVANNLIIEAMNEDEAIRKMEEITEDYSKFCSCCGPRWGSYAKGTEVPMVYSTKIKEQSHNDPFGSSTIIYYYDGTKDKLWYPLDHNKNDDED